MRTSRGFTLEYLIKRGAVMPPEMTKRYLQKPKIIMNDLHEVYAAGIDKATNEEAIRMSDMIMKICYASALSTLHRVFGWGHNRCMKFIKEMDEDVIWMADKNEALERCFEDVGIRINFSEGIDRVHER